MSARERGTKISGAAAEDEAIALLQQLSREPDRALELSADLNERYSAAPRKTILTQIRQRLPRLQRAVPAKALGFFLEVQCEEVKDQTFDDHLREVLTVAIEIPGEDAVRIAADLTAKILGSSKYPAIKTSSIPLAASILTLVFEDLCKAETPIRKRLDAWANIAQPLMCVTQGAGPRFQATDAGRILNALSGVDRKVLPDSLVACAPGLILLAGLEGSAPFLASGTGRPIAGLLSKLTQSAASSGTTPKPSIPESRNDQSPREQLANAFDRAKRLCDQVVDDCERQLKELHEHAADLAYQIERGKKESEERERQVRILKVEHQEELQQCNQRIRGLEDAKKELAESVERLRSDLRLSDHNALQNVAEKEVEQRHRLGEMLNAALASMRRDLEQALRKYPQSEEIRNVGISFDSLHRKLLREASHLDETRLPKELLDPNHTK